METIPIKVLLIEDNSDHAQLVQEMLAEAEANDSDLLSFEFLHCERLEQAQETLARGSLDVILLDLLLAQNNGLDNLRWVMETAPGTPVVTLSNKANEALALQSVQSGAQDYLVKGEMNRHLLVRSIRYAIQHQELWMKLQSSESRFQTIIEKHADGIVIAGMDNRVRFVNPAAESILDRSAEDFLDKPFYIPLANNKKAEIEILRKDGEVRVTEMTVVATEWHMEQVHLVWLRDITDRRRVEERMRLATRVFENTAEGIFIADAQANTILVNKAFTEITGYTQEEVIGQSIHLFHSDHRDSKFFEQMLESLSITKQWQGEIWNRRKDGEIYPEWLTISTVLGELGEVVNYVAVFTDISTRKQTEDRLRYLATHDPLTNLPNRELLLDRLNHVLARCIRNQQLAGVMLLDLDNFKTINDTFGHSHGDLVLQAVSARLVGCLRKSDTVARLAGDEFTFILEDISKPEDCAIVAQKILAAVTNPYLLDGSECNLTASIGISVYPKDGESVDTLMKTADIAMYRAKENRNRYEFYTPQ